MNSSYIYRKIGLFIQICGPSLAFYYTDNKLVFWGIALFFFSIGSLILFLTGFYHQKK